MPSLRFTTNTFEVSEEQTVLEALEAQGLDVPSSCRAGACRSCMMRVVSGEVPPAAQVGLSPAQRELGYFLACVCRPSEDLEITTVDAAAETSATIVSVTRTSGAVLLIRLRTAEPLEYRAGQFVTLLRDDGLARAYSLASVPAIDGDRELELHVRHYPDGAMSGWLAKAEVGTSLTLRGPYGECFYGTEDPQRPLLLVGTGTGLAPLYGIVRQALKSGHSGPITLCYGALRAVDLYHREELAALAAEHSNLELVASALEVGDAVGVVDTPLDVVALERAAAADLSALKVYLCGAPQLITGLRRRLFIAGVSMSSIVADAFLPAVPAASA